MGSLTTPPCSEQVGWIISTKPLHIDVDTFKRVKKVVKFNARYTQDGLGQQNLSEQAAGELNAKWRDVMDRRLRRLEAVASIGYYGNGSLQRILKTSKTIVLYISILKMSMLNTRKIRRLNNVI